MSASLLPLERYDALIFDLGGVIVSLYPERTIRAMSELFGRDASAAYTQTAQNETFDRFERGEISASQFRKAVFDHFGATRRDLDEAFDAAWNAMLGAIDQDTLAALRTLGESKRLFLLSNTNEIHVARFLSDYETRHAGEYGPWESLFEHVHYSHELGMRKPEPRIFEELVRLHDLDRGRTLFVDDNHANVESARTLGLLGEIHPTNASFSGRFFPPDEAR